MNNKQYEKFGEEQIKRNIMEETVSKCSGHIHGCEFKSHPFYILYSQKKGRDKKGPKKYSQFRDQRNIHSF